MRSAPADHSSSERENDTQASRTVESADERAPPEPPVGALNRALASLSAVVVPLFSLFFMIFAIFFAGYAAVEFARPLLEDGDVIKGLVQGLHSGVVALAVYELAQIVREEHDGRRPQNTMRRIRRGVARFGNVVFVALVLEALIMVIKYNQQDLAGFLYYPAALVLSASVLLIALGVFIRLAGPPAPNEAAHDAPPGGPYKKGSERLKNNHSDPFSIAPEARPYSCWTPACAGVTKAGPSTSPLSPATSLQ